MATTTSGPGSEPGVLQQLYQQLEPYLVNLSEYPVAIFFIVIVLAFIVSKITTRLLTLVVGQLTSRTRFMWDDKLIKLVSRPIFITLLLLGTQMAFIPLKLSQSAVNVLSALIITLLIIIWSTFLIRFISIILTALSETAKEHSVIRVQTKPLFQNLAYIVVFILSVYLIFSSWNIDMTAWLASAGIAGIAIGFAAKDTLANLFAGVFILADSPYKIGDYVVLDSGERGMVTHIGIRSTRILTRGDVEITIPNSVMGNTRISNESGGPHKKFRINVKVGVAYGSDIDKVKEILLDIAAKEEGVCEDPSPSARFRVFGNSSLDLELLCWVEEPDMRGRVLDALNTTIYKRFNEEGIEIPYSKHDVFIKEMPVGNTPANNE